MTSAADPVPRDTGQTASTTATAPAVAQAVGDDFAWLVETSDDGDTWWPELHPVHDDRDSGGIEGQIVDAYRAQESAQELAVAVLARRLGLLHGDVDYDWDELWFRVLVWDHRRAAEITGGPHQQPEAFDKHGTSAAMYARYLRACRAEPHAVEIATPRRARDLARQHVPQQAQ